jgi:hypothetical protein
VLLFSSSCCLAFCCCLSIWYFPPFTLCRFGNDEFGFTVELFFQVQLWNYVYYNYVFFCLEVNFYFSIYFGETYLCSNFNIYFFIKLGTILTSSINMFIVCKIHTQLFCIALQFIFYKRKVG